MSTVTTTTQTERPKHGHRKRLSGVYSLLSLVKNHVLSSEPAAAVAASEQQRERNHEKIPLTNLQTKLDCVSSLAAAPRDQARDDAKQTTKVPIRIPDLFKDIMGTEAPVNPYYEPVKAQCDEYVARTLHLDEKTAKKSARTDLAYFSAMCAPTAPEHEFYVFQVWQEWVFWFDDQFDEGHLSSDPLAAAEEVIDTLAVLDADQSPIEVPPTSDWTQPGVRALGIRQIFQLMWSEFKKTASPSQQARFRRAHRNYMLGLLKQVQLAALHATGGQSPGALDTDAFLQYKRATVGAEPCYAVMMWACGLDLPDDVVEHAAVVAHYTAAIDITLLQNDIISLQKDVLYGVEHNAVLHLVARGGGSGSDRAVSMQKAVEAIDAMLDGRYARWHAAGAALPSWGAETNALVKRWLDLYLRTALAHLHWSFRSGRYFGDKGPQVKETRMMELVMNVA